MRRPEIIERERRWALPAAIGSFGVLLFVVASRVVATAANVGDIDIQADLLRSYADDSSLVIGDVLSGIGFALLAVPLTYIFRAEQARSDRVRPGLVGVVIAGPIFFGVGIVLQALAFQAVGSDFVANNGAHCVPVSNECVNNLIAEHGLANVAGGLTLAGVLGIAVALIYTGLNGMRTGILTRFMGSFGMAIGVAFVLFGPLSGLPLAPLLVMLYALALGLLFLGARPGGRPPAWEAAEAIPWPSAAERAAGPKREEEPVEGRAAEIFPDAAAGDEPEDDVDDDEPATDSNGAPRKRKRR